MLRKMIFITLGVASLLLVVWLGILASSDPSFVIWFGLAAAILAPFAFVLFGHVHNVNDRDLLNRLSMVPQLGELMDKAQSEEERIRILEEERLRLSETIRAEARFQMLTELRSQLEQDLAEKIKQHDAINSELNETNLETQSSSIQDEIEVTRKMLLERKKGRVIVIRVGKNTYRFAARNFGSDPLSALIFIVLLNVEKWQKQKARSSKEVMGSE